MTAAELKQIVHVSGKRGVIAYKGKDTRKQFDESVSQKKINLIYNFIGEKTEEVRKILS